MNAAKETCPNCKRNGISAWAWLFATWPAYAKCSYCNTKTRLRISPWLNMLAQLFGGILLVMGIIAGVNGNYLGGAAGIILGFTSYFLPLFFGKLEVVP